MVQGWERCEHSHGQLRWLGYVDQVINYCSIIIE